MPTGKTRWALTVCACTALYVGASRIGFALAYVDGAVSTVWVPAGLGLVMVVLGGRRMWPAILIGEFLANLIHGSSATASLGMGIGDVLEALTGQTLLKYANFRPMMDRVRDVFALLILGGLTATLVGASFGTASLMLFGSLHWSGAWSTWYTWWLGDVMGVIVVAPLLFSHLGRGFRLARGIQALELFAFLTVLVPVVLIAFGASPAIGFLTLPALVWGTLHFGQRGATLANAVIVCALVVIARRADAPLAGLSLSNRLLLIQDLGAVAAMTTLVLAVEVAERRREANQVAAITAVATANAQDVPLDELLPLGARAAGEYLGLRELLVVRDAGVNRSVVLAGWSAGDPWVGAQAPEGGLLVPIRVHGVEWGQLLVPEGATTSNSPPLPEVRNSLTRFARQIGLGIASADARQALIERASTDPLTGLANHRRFHERLHTEVSRATRHGRPLSVAMIDIDGFKLINDAVGHVAGDEVLATVASRIREVMRPEVTVARLGGDEIGVLLPECDVESAHSVVERARKMVCAKPIGAAGIVRISAGVCDNARASGAEQLREFADAALYWVKAHGRNQVMAYSPAAIRDLSDDERAARMVRTQAAIGVRALARAIDAKDPMTAQHSEQVAAFAAALARACGWRPERVALLREAAMVHDVGKLAISNRVLGRGDDFSDEELAQLRRHPEMGAQIAAEILESEQLDWIRWHHENADGSGFPDGLTAAQLPEGAKLLALADAFSKLVCGSAHRTPKPVDEAVAECVEQAGRQFAPEAVAALLAAHESGAFRDELIQAVGAGIRNASSAQASG
jgi:diguanylate cyclase (GGDEF)-like protein/putative nucleotidyltransferase with HDIG domain